MNKKQLYVLLAAILLVCVIAVVSKCSASEKQTVVSPTDDSSQFVTLTDAVPDVILEIRYFGTYNFVGTRIDGYLEPTALLTKKAADSLRAISDDLKAIPISVVIPKRANIRAIIARVLRVAPLRPSSLPTACCCAGPC